MEYQSKTFCAAPWFQIRKENDNKYRPCCQIDISQTHFGGKIDYTWPNTRPDEFLNSQYIQYLRNNLNQGVQLPECRRCWEKESLLHQSERQIINNFVTSNQGQNLDKTWMPLYFKQKNNFEFDFLLSAEIKVSNLCNFSCAMCSPKDSSQIYSIWKSNQSHKIVQTFLNTYPNYLTDIKKRFLDSDYDYLDTILNLCPKHIKLLGGEPLIDKILLEKLVNLDPLKKSKISLLFITNGSVDLGEFSNSLSGYKQVNFVVSLEGIGSVQDYVRRGSNWNQIEKNILKWNATHRPVNIAFTLQCFNAMHLPELHKWCHDNNINLSINTLENPEYLSIKSIPPKIREQIFKKFNQIPYWSGSQINAFKKLFDQHPHKKELLPTLKEFTDWYDQSQQWSNIFPEWVEFLSN